MSLTWTGEDEFGAAAGEAVQQRFGPDVKVEQGSWAAQFGQTEPGPDVRGLVGQEQGHGVPLLQPGFSLQGPGHLVAPSVHLRVRILPTLEVDQDLVRAPPHRVQEVVQDAVEGSGLLVPVQSEAQPEAPQDVGAVLPEVRAEGPDVEAQQDQQSGCS